MHPTYSTGGRAELDWAAPPRNHAEPMPSFSFAVQGQSRNATAAVESMLGLLLPMLGNHWRIGEAAMSDVVLLDAATLDQVNRAGLARPSALYVVFEESTPPPSNAFSTVRRPLNSSSLIEVLHKAQSELGRRKSGNAETTVVAHSVDKDSTENRAIKTSMRAAVRWVLQGRSSAASVISLKQSRVFSVLTDLGFTTRLDSSEIAGLIRANAQVMVLTLNDGEKSELLGRQRKFYPLTKLEWIYWLAGSNGELRLELNAATPYRLSRWPDFSRLPHYRADVRLASLLKADALAVGELAERAGVRVETAVNFVNACWSLGLLAPSPAGAPMSPVSDAGPRASRADEKEEPATAGHRLGWLRGALGLGSRRPRGA